jgi:hypothetical protein
VIPGPRGRQLRAVIVRALREVYDENSRRFAPEDLGDNNITFGVNVSQNLRFAIDRDTADLEGAAIERPRNSFVLRLKPRFSVHFYKAPPGVTDIRMVRFDESEMKLELRHENAAQLSFEFDDAVSLSATIPSHVVIVHFGGPETSFQRADVGSPYSTASGGCRGRGRSALTSKRSTATPATASQHPGRYQARRAARAASGYDCAMRRTPRPATRERGRPRGERAL